MNTAFSDQTTSPVGAGANIPVVSGLAALAQRYDALLCDVWGVLIDGRAHFPAAAAALAKFRHMGGTVLLISNASRPNEQILQQLARLGAPRDSFDDVVTAGELTVAEIVARKGLACHHMGPQRDVGLFEAAARALGGPAPLVPLEEADFVVCTGLVDEGREAPADYDARLAAMRARDLVMLCANPDIVVKVGEDLVWCAGALAERYAAIGGKVVMTGKPHPPIYQAALKRLGALRGGTIEKARVLAIGDGALTDLAGAARAGLDALFVTDGVHHDELFPRPGAGLDWRALENLLQRAKARPIA
ncbi:MAG: TIGR01459 family HAD-type hydrolase, partial [Methylocystis sp.]|nr:TIGR01459 family HAD-type hydrolase [Methylocystis sp.]